MKKECLWCEKEFETNNPEDELCEECAKYSSKEEMEKAKQDRWDIKKHVVVKRRPKGLSPEKKPLPEKAKETIRKALKKR